MLILCGVPLLYMEMAVGQFTQQGPIGALAKLCPILKGKHNFLGRVLSQLKGYSNTCVKRPLTNRQNKDLYDNW